MTLAKNIVEYIQKWAANLGISDYKFDFHLLSNREMGGDYARVDTDDVTREVNLEFNKHRLTKEQGELERTVVHELLHVRCNEYTEFVNEIIKTFVLSPKTRRLLIKQADKLEHKQIVAITDSLLKEKH